MITNQNIEIPIVESLTREKKELIEKLSNIDRELVKIENQKKSFLSKKSFRAFLICGIFLILCSVLVPIFLIKNNGNSLLITLLFTVLPVIGVFLLGQSIRLKNEYKEKVKEWESSNANKDYKLYVEEKAKLKDRLFYVNNSLTNRLEEKQ